MKHLPHRLGQILVTLIGVSFLTFCLTYIAPGDPAAMVLEAGDHIVSEELLAKTRAEMGLDKPFLVQYGNWIGGLLHGDMGISAKKPVIDKLADGFSGTLFLAAVTMIFVIAISVPLGVISAVYSNKWQDHLIRLGAFVGVSMPGFWLGLLFLYVFGLKLGWFPITNVDISLRGVVLPAITLALSLSTKYIRQIRTMVLDELHQDYVIGARARGISERAILWRHVLPNAMLPLVTLFGMTLGYLLGGVAVIEIVFSWPGLGNMAVHAIMMRDYPLIEGFVLWTAIVYTVINLIVDVSYSFLDPKLRKGGGA